MKHASQITTRAQTFSFSIPFRLDTDNEDNDKNIIIVKTTIIDDKIIVGESIFFLFLIKFNMAYTIKN